MRHVDEALWNPKALLPSDQGMWVLISPQPIPYSTTQAHSAQQQGRMGSVVQKRRPPPPGKPQPLLSYWTPLSPEIPQAEGGTFFDILALPHTLPQKIPGTAQLMGGKGNWRWQQYTNILKTYVKVAPHLREKGEAHRRVNRLRRREVRKGRGGKDAMEAFSFTCSQSRSWATNWRKARGADWSSPAWSLPLLTPQSPALPASVGQNCDGELYFLLSSPYPDSLPLLECEPRSALSLALGSSSCAAHRAFVEFKDKNQRWPVSIEL